MKQHFRLIKINVLEIIISHEFSSGEFLLLILQSFDWLANFHLKLLQVMLYNCQLLCFWRLALSTVAEIDPQKLKASSFLNHNRSLSLLAGCLREGELFFLDSRYFMGLKLRISCVTQLETKLS
jgi:hypothetical protein